MTSKEIDVIYEGVEALLKAKAWEFLDKHMELMIMSIWRTEIDELIVYLTATRCVKSKLPSRAKYFAACTALFPDQEMWKDVE